MKDKKLDLYLIAYSETDNKVYMVIDGVYRELYNSDTETIAESVNRTSIELSWDLHELYKRPGPPRAK